MVNTLAHYPPSGSLHVIAAVEAVVAAGSVVTGTLVAVAIGRRGDVK